MRPQASSFPYLESMVWMRFCNLGEVTVVTHAVVSDLLHFAFIKKNFYVCIYLWLLCSACGILVPQPRINVCPLQWKLLLFSH